MKTSCRKIISLMIGILLISSFLINSAPAAKAQTYPFSQIKAYLTSELQNCTQTIDLSAYNIPYSQENTNALSQFVFYDLPECFHTASGRFRAVNGKLTAFIPTYDYTKSQYDTMLQQCESAARKLLAGIKNNSSLSQAEKALLIHDRLALTCEYATGSTSGLKVTNPVYSIYGALVNGKAVCYGYARAYQYLLNQVGIVNRLCSSLTLNHTWNIITVNNKEYHVDVTYDDPTYDKAGQVFHNNFLRSTNGLYSQNHKATDYDSSPKDTTYDNAFWQSSDTQFCLFNGTVYYFNNQNGTLYRYPDGKAMLQDSSVWKRGSSYVWNDNYTRLAVCAKGILYSTPKSVKLFNPETNAVSDVFTPSFSNYSNENIFGFTVKDETIVCEVCENPNYTATTKQTATQKTPLQLGQAVYENEPKKEDLTSSAVNTDNIRLYQSTVTVPAGCTYLILQEKLGSLRAQKADGSNVYLQSTVCTGDKIQLTNNAVYIVVVPGDNSGDGKITAEDARNALRYSVGLDIPTDVQKAATLVTDNPDISAADARVLLRCAVGLEQL